VGDSAERDEVPVIHANFVTSNLTTDELTMELRWFHAAHKDNLRTDTDEVFQLPGAEPEVIMSLPPAARVVLTFAAAKMLKKFLDAAFPQAEKSRRSE